MKLNCRTKSQAFHNAGGIVLVWKKRVTDLLSVRTMTGLVDPHKMWLYSMKAKYIARNSSAYIDILICDGENVLDPSATGAYVFLTEVSFSSAFSSIMRA